MVFDREDQYSGDLVDTDPMRVVTAGPGRLPSHRREPLATEPVGEDLPGVAWVEQVEQQPVRRAPRRLLRRTPLGRQATAWRWLTTMRSAGALPEQAFAGRYARPVIAQLRPSSAPFLRRFNGRMDDKLTRVLPQSDLTAILDVLVSVGAQLAIDELDQSLADRLGRRLKKHGVLEDTSTGQINAVVSDLCQRVHWALGVGTDYPADAPRVTVHRIRFGDEQSAWNFVSWIGQSGGSGEVQRDGGIWEVAATYPDLRPSAEYQRRIAELTRIAERHGGEYAGADA
jgi:hypothetical protein